MKTNIQSASQTEPFEAVAPFYDRLMAGVPYPFWVEYLEGVWRRHKIDPRTVLDLACGTGTVSLLLERRGYNVFGVDKSEPMLVQARIKAASEGAPITFLQQNAPLLNLTPHRFDSVICLFDSLNNLLEPGELASTFDRVEAHLEPDGLFVFDMNTEVAFTQGLFNQKSSSFDGPLQYVWKADYDRKLRLCTIHMDFTYHVPKSEIHHFTEVHVQKAYDLDEIADALEQAGLGQITTYDAYSFKPAKRRSDRVFFVATRPD